MMFFVFFVALSLSINDSSAQLPTHTDTLVLQDSSFIEFKFFMINPIDTLFRLEVFKDNRKFIRSYTKKIDRNLLQGVTIFYFPSGQVESEGIFNKGKSEGKHYTFFNNGSIKSIINYNNGMYIGDFIEYYDNGSKKQEGEYDYFEKKQWYILYSSKIGKWKTYHANGKIKEEQFYYTKAVKRKITVLEEYTTSDGKFDDIRYFTESDLPYGVLDESEYKRNVKHGEWKYWDERGKLIKIEIYNKDKLIETKTY